MLKKSFSAGDIGLHPRTFAKISNILEKNGFLVILSRKPFKAVVPYNSFLGNLLAYYGHASLAARRKDIEYLKEIEKELSKFRKLRARNFQRYRSILEAFQIRFIHHSLSIEGNPITLAQTFRLLQDKIVPENLKMDSVMEVQGYQKAFQQMLKNVQDEIALSLDIILNYHFMAMQYRPDIAGKIRDVPVFIRGNEDFEVADVENIKPMLEELIKRHNALLKKTTLSLPEILDFAAYLHNEFQHIHPFFDGNSRTTRIITFHFLLMNDIPIFDIPLGMLEEYVRATKGSASRNDAMLKQALQIIILHNLKTINEKLAE
ncbi:MAG: Fic family protein [Syntrophaceae bacterium]|nr:Fic family protein [Syntrophaceae bacterium]